MYYNYEEFYELADYENKAAGLNLKPIEIACNAYYMMEDYQHLSDCGESIYDMKDCLIAKMIKLIKDNIGTENEISGADSWIRCLSEVIPSNRRVVAIQIDLEMEEGKDYKELFGHLSEQINATGDFVCRGIDFTDDITERYYAKR